MLEITFFAIILIIFYVYLGYPLVLYAFTYFGKPIKRGDIVPSVTLFIPAHNEADVIRQKLENSLNLDYPWDKLEIIIASDGSTDGTGDIVREFINRGVLFFDSPERRGKNVLINRYINNSNGEIIVFTDANSFYKKDAIKKLIRNFFDERVGCVVGKLKYIDDNTSVGKGEGLYFRYESVIKKLESRWGTVPIVTGAIYAMRRDLFLPLEPDVANDFAHPVQVGAKGYKVLFEPEAIAYEQTTSSISEEFKRRARIVTRGFTAFGKYWRQYHMLSGMRGFCFVSHKLLRWFVPFFLIGLFIANFFLLHSIIFKIILYGQLTFYSAALCGAFIKGKFGKLFIIPFYFCMINFAALTGFINYVRGRRQSVWDVAKTTR